MVLLDPSRGLHSPEDGVSSQGKNAPPSLESREKKIKISKRFWNVEVARKTPLVDGERSTKPLKYQRWILVVCNDLPPAITI